MESKSMIVPTRRRHLRPPFAWIDRNFLFSGFWEQLSHEELLLYFFLILVSDGNGLSYYSYDRICHFLKLDVESYIQARNGLIHKDLIAFERGVFQVLSLPSPPGCRSRAPNTEGDFQSLSHILARVAPPGL